MMPDTVFLKVEREAHDAVRKLHQLARSDVRQTVHGARCIARLDDVRR